MFKSSSLATQIAATMLAGTLVFSATGAQAWDRHQPQPVPQQHSDNNNGAAIAGAAIIGLLTMGAMMSSPPAPAYAAPAYPAQNYPVQNYSVQAYPAQAYSPPPPAYDDNCPPEADRCDVVRPAYPRWHHHYRYNDGYSQYDPGRYDPDGRMRPDQMAGVTERDRNWWRHLSWCEQHYDSYDKSTNSFTDYNGYQRQCVSPYGS